MDDEARRRLPHGSAVDKEIPSHASPFVMKRQAMTAGFDERQKQLFNEALIAILTVDMTAEKITELLTKAYDITIQVFGWQMLADTRIPSAVEGRRFEQLPSPPATERISRPDSASPILQSCTGCHGHSLTLRGKLVQCDDCGTIQPVIIDRPRVVKNGVVVQELSIRYFATGDAAMAALREENRRSEKDESEANKRNPGKDERQAALFDRWQISSKQIVNVALSGGSLVLTFHDGTIERRVISDSAIFSAISYLIRVLDIMTWAREELENRLLSVKRKFEAA